MARNRFVSVERVRITLSDGDWIEVKKRLNTGDQKLLEAAGYKPPVEIKDLNGNTKIITPIDWAVYEIERAIIFLLDWSFRGEDDKPVKYTPDALRNTDPLTFAEINDAIYKHVLEVASEKNGSGATKQPSPESNQISQS